MTGTHMPHVTIEELDVDGYGIARLPDGGVVYVKDGVPGDVVDLEHVETRDHRVDAVISRVHSASPGRVRPPCLYAAACTGCRFQHLSYHVQLSMKHARVVAALDALGATAESVADDIVASPLLFGYRNSVDLASLAPEGQYGLGIRDASAPSSIAVEQCLLLPERVRTIPRSLTGALRYLAGRYGELGVKGVGVRVSESTGDLEIALWTGTQTFPRAATTSTIARATGATSVVRVLSRPENARRPIAGLEVLAGPGYWRDRIGPHEYFVSALSPYPANSRGAEALINHSLACLDVRSRDRVAHLYAGPGVLTAHLAARSNRVVAFEPFRHALADMRRILAKSKRNAEVVGGDPAREIGRSGSFDLVLLGEPPGGLSSADALAAASVCARTLVYVSHDAQRFTQSAREIVRLGYRLTHVRAFDLAPHTSRIDVVAAFSR